MIKRIRSDQLKPGMFIHDLNCGWMDHPFAFNTFKVNNDRTIKQIIDSGIRELYIDNSKGLDVSDAQTHDEYHAEINERIITLTDSHIIEPLTPAPLKKEILMARTLHREARNVVHHLLTEIRFGKQFELDKTSPIVESITDSIFRNKDAFISLSRIKKRDEYTFQHSVSVCALMVAFCRAMGYERATILEAGTGGLLHDIGKMKVPDHILNKPAPLTEREYAVMKTHAPIGRELLKITPGVSEIAVTITGQHHERFDGTGYPDKIKMDEISLFGQMASIVDVYDALTSDRIYHKALEPTTALKKLFEWSKFHFNAKLVERFICMIGIYPVGSLVKLESGMLGIVVNPGNENLLRPIVRTVYDLRREHSVTPHDVDLSLKLNDRIVQHESANLWGIDTLKFI